MNVFDSGSEKMTLLGKYFQIVFLLVNLILMLNVVIALLSESFSALSQYSDGLYCDTLMKNFGHNEWDDHYGSLACACSPF